MDKFYEDLHTLLATVSKLDKLIVLGLCCDLGKLFIAATTQQERTKTTSSSGALQMRLSFSLLGRFIAWRRVPGSLWGGKHRKIPRLTGARKAAFMDELLLTQQNERYLSKPYLSAEAEATTLAIEQARELAAEDQVFYKVYEDKFRMRFPDRKLENFWSHLNTARKFSI
nr:unnamed protein product [Spirometra erinaceieuropaei]